MSWAILFALSVSLGEAQTWRKLGGSAVEVGLAGPAGGPVRQVWFSDDGSRLFARTSSGLLFVTADFETWAAAAPETLRTESAANRVSPTLPAGNRDSVIGENQHDVAVSPRDPLFVAVGSDSGVWMSHDGGLSWSGLNSELPNLPIRSLLGKNRIAVDGLGTAELAGRTGWVATSGGDHADAVTRGALSAELRSQIRVLAGSGDFWYAGAADGRIWVSSDARAHWTLAPVQAAGAIERFSVDRDAPRIAIAAAASRGAHLFRTVNGGQTWLDMTGTLTGAPAHGIAADRADGAVYVATDRGVFLSRMDLNALGNASPWVDVSEGLPSGAAVRDVLLERGGQQLTVAIDGWGVYVERAPHQTGNARLLNAADLSNRAAAPGGLVSAVGVPVFAASAAGHEFPILAQSQIQIPFETAPANLEVELNRSVRVGLTVKAVAPAVFVDRDGAPLLLDPDTGMMLDGSQPAVARSSLQLLATGLGRVTPDWPSGMPAPLSNVPTVAAEVHAFLNGVPIEVTKATLAPGYVGMYLVEIRLPAVLDAGAADIYLEAAGETSNHVRLAVSY